MEVRNPLSFLNKREASHTKTFITNLAIGLAAFALFSGISSVASAQETEDDTPTLSEVQTRSEAATEAQQAALDARRDEMASRTEAIREQVEERKENSDNRAEVVREQIIERQGALESRSRDRILALANNISEKMLAAVARIEQIIDRFEARMELLAQNGTDVSEAQAKLDEAKGHLARATAMLETEVNDLVDDAVGSDSPREAWQKAKVKYQDARDAIKSAHQAVREALSLLKESIDRPAAPETTEDVPEDTETES